jgi:outer membrane receptor protein involved in Fe transport
MKSWLFLALCLASAPAFAAEPDIVITGDRRALDRDKLAGNSAALTQEELETIGAQHPTEALGRIPGVDFHRGSGVETLPAIRSPVLTGGQGAGSILVLQDGVPIRAPGFANINEEFETPLDFASRLEVTRGPGSALYGSNAVHGLINVITPAPGRGPGDPRAEATAAIAQFGRAELTLTAPFGQRDGEGGAVCKGADDPPGVDTVLWCARKPSAVRGFLGLNVSHETGWRDDAGVDQQQALVKAQTDAGGWTFAPSLYAMNLNQETAGYVEGTDAYKDSALPRRNDNPEAFRDEKLVRAQMAVSRQLGPGEITIIPFARWIEAELLQHFLPSKALETSGQRGAGFEAAYYYDVSDRLSWIFGADLDRTRASLREVQSLPDQPNGYVQGVHYDYVVDATVLAAYAQARWSFAPRWSVTAGLRGERVSYDYDNHAPDGDFGRFRRPADRSDDFTTVMPKLGIVRALAGGGSAYLNLARGARPPQASDLYSLQTLQNVGDQQSEIIDSAELGVRKPFGAGRIEVSLYHMSKRHSSFRNADGFTVPDARTRHDGIELSASYPLGAHFSAAGWITYANHTYRFTDPSARAGESIAYGDQIDSAPHWLANGQLVWTPISGVRAELGWTHVGKYFTNAANTRTYPGHDLFDLRLEWNANERAALFAAIRNLTNTDYAERADYAFGNDRYFPGEDRALTFGVRASF